ncbi:MAG TPA: hypothetical protein VME70_04695 [Mycobacteriales bacterium]|nr:hypothetical protein [Mycobacteriales bacterium]
MSFMDKVKQQAEQAMVKAQQGVQQGQTKLNDMQTQRNHDSLLRDLGAAYYAQQRSGGSAEAVTAALDALDAHAASAAATASAPPESGTTTPPAGGAAATGGGSFNLDDV